MWNMKSSVPCYILNFKFIQSMSQYYLVLLRYRFKKKLIKLHTFFTLISLGYFANYTKNS